MMKRALCICVAFGSLAFAVAADAPAKTNQVRRPVTPEVRAKIQAQILRKTGGWVIKEGSGSGRCVFVNTQTKLPKEAFATAAEKIGALLSCRVGFIDGAESVTVQSASAALKATKAQAAIFIVDDPLLPSVLIAPENSWAFINAAALARDNALPPVLAKRATREAWRVFAQLLGASNAQMEGACVLESVTSLIELDALKADCFCPEPLSKITAHLRTIGVTPYLRSTYRRACEQGWAPAPTNDIQKAVWEQVKQDKERGPTNPIKIEFKK